ncbi:MAG: SapC family protein, partial [Aquificaceae bacterium]|nr:SapC family protein [Aquificaceae bacterium]
MLFQKVELLDTVKHKDATWGCFGANCKQSCCYVPVRSSISLTEAVSLSRYFPIQFPLIKYQENQDPQYELNIFFKLDKDPKSCVYLKEPEGCQLGKDKPIACKQYPFQIVKDNLGRNLIQIDLTCPGWKISADSQGETPPEQTRVFENGNLNEFFKKNFVDYSLQFVNSGNETRLFINSLVAHNLLVGGEYRYRGMAIPINFVSEERLLNLPKEILVDFRQRGYLHVIYAHLNSLVNYQKLIDAYLDRNEVKTDEESATV